MANVIFNFENVEWHKINQENRKVPMDQTAYAARFFIPFAGDWTMLSKRPMISSAMGYPIYINEERNEIIYDSVIGEATGDKIMEQFSRLQDFIATSLVELDPSTAAYNKALFNIAEKAAELGVQVEANQKDLANLIKFPERKN